MELRTLNVEELTRTAKLGEGTYGEVFRVVHTKTGEIFALKRIKLSHEDEGISATTIREISLLRDLIHPNIVPLISVIISSGDLSLVFEFADDDLRKLMDRYYNDGAVMPRDLVRKYTYQLLKGLLHCHVNGVIHRDIKPGNLLVSEGSLKICDFGLARGYTAPSRTITSEVQTLWYRAPEVLLSEGKYSIAVDVWAVGTVMGEMIAGSPIFPGKTPICQLYSIFKCLGTPNEDTYPGISKLLDYSTEWPKFKPKGIVASLEEVMYMKVLEITDLELNLLEGLLVINPKERMTVKDALSHPYFDPIREDELSTYLNIPKERTVKGAQKKMKVTGQKQGYFEEFKW